MELEAALERVTLQPSGEEEHPQVVDTASISNTERHHFRHSQLPGGRYIRLLRFIEGNPECISITLHAFPLEQLPDYEALSYTWGKATDSDNDEDNGPNIFYEILVDSKPFSITENLFDGLTELSKEAMGYLWVDALCIDQTNMEERASQVRLMGDIYSSASLVIIWLGKAIDAVDAVIWLQERYLPLAEEGHSPAEAINYELLGALNITTDKWVELWDLYDKFFTAYSWFSRAWVVQEFLLSQNNVIRCGQKTLDSTILRRLSQQGLDSGNLSTSVPVKFHSISELRTELINGVPSEDFLTGISLSAGAKTAEEQWCFWILFLVDTIRPRNTTCSHDKIYAIFGLALKSIPPSWDHGNFLDVNYEQSAEDTFSSFATVLLENLPTLTILSYVSTSSGDEPKQPRALPSWCPDFGTFRRDAPLIVLSQLNWDQPYAFKASRSLARDNGPCLVSGRILLVSGKPVARIAKARQATGFVFSTDTMFDPPGVEGFFDSCRDLEPTYSLTGQDRVEALWRTLLVDCDGLLGSSTTYPPPTTETFSPAFADFLAIHSALLLSRKFRYKGKEFKGEEREDFLDSIRKREQDFRSSAVELPTLSAIIKLAEEFTTEELIPQSAQNRINSSSAFQSRAGYWNAGRRLFTTDQKWLGLGPENLEQDDEVWLLKHANVPFILRPRGDSQYTLVGEAYVHGIMHGELVDAPGGTEGFREIQIV
jgi:Heterokaryon incompatibility protein (HET)